MVYITYWPSCSEVLLLAAHLCGIASVTSLSKRNMDNGRVNNNKRVCIIGAGPCGMSAIYQFYQQPVVPEIVCFDKQGSVAGLWNYSWRTGITKHGQVWGVVTVLLLSSIIFTFVLFKAFTSKPFTYFLNMLPFKALCCKKKYFYSNILSPCWMKCNKAVQSAASNNHVQFRTKSRNNPKN